MFHRSVFKYHMQVRQEQVRGLEEWTGAETRTFDSSVELGSVGTVGSVFYDVVLQTYMQLLLVNPTDRSCFCCNVSGQVRRLSPGRRVLVPADVPLVALVKRKEIRAFCDDVSGGYCILTSFR